MSLELPSLRRAYREARARPAEVLEAVLSTIAADDTPGVWTHRRAEADVLAEARSLEARFADGARPALYGVPFAVKDNVDVAGVPTTAACPDFAYVPKASATVVARLQAEGAIYVGKTNLDQLATGLVGVRSPYGVPPNPFDPRCITGGSSSGSAAAVARGMIAFAVSTDTAGSGRVPAALNNVVGLKPSRGLLSLHGVVPACRSLDCISITALTCRDARDVAEAAAQFDPTDPYSRKAAAAFRWRAGRARPALAVPRPEDLVFDDGATRDAFEAACARIEGLGFRLERVAMTPFYDAGQLLYEGPWIAERLSGVEAFVRAHPGSLLPVIREILMQGDGYRATDAFRALYRLAQLRQAIVPLWERVGALLVPSVPGIPHIAQVLADPIRTNTRLGTYTTFANLLDLAAVAVPTGLRPDGLPSSVTLLGAWGSDPRLLAIGGEIHQAHAGPLGATGWSAHTADDDDTAAGEGVLRIAVVGAHLAGMPLNHELTDRGGRFVGAARTAPAYRLFALAGTKPPKPGLVRVGAGTGARIELEVWELPTGQVGSFLANVPAPLAIGTIELENESVHGFLCEPHAVAGATDISSYGGWRAYCAAS